MIVFTEITALVELREKMKRENTVVAFIMLDNLEELAQYVRVSYRQAANEIDAILKNWAASMKGLLREYDRDRYLLIITREMLDECIKNKFEILDSIRDVRLGDDSMSVTVSMGISVGIGPLSERENEAMLALDLALQRGGDQVVIRHGNETEFSAGAQGHAERTRVRSRVNAAVLSARISESSNVLVMGHKNRISTLSAPVWALLGFVFSAACRCGLSPTRKATTSVLSPSGFRATASMPTCSPTRSRALTL